MAIEFRDGLIDAGDGAELVAALHAEVTEIYAGSGLDVALIPAAGPAELSPPAGAFLIGYEDGVPVCCGGVQRLDERACELRRMFVAPAARGRGFGRVLLTALEARARELGFSVVRLETGPRQPAAQHLYRSAGYDPIANFNGNPVATFFAEKRLA